MPRHTYLKFPKKISTKRMQIGDIVRFSYAGRQRLAIVLNPKWEECMHGLSLKDLGSKSLFMEIMDLIDEFPDPYDFYHKGYATDLATTQTYRSYKIKKISNMRRVELK